MENEGKKEDKIWKIEEEERENAGKRRRKRGWKMENKGRNEGE